ncbi:MAG: T9SS type A sorting domain-containing protein, partial [Chitinophagaceae bacterium]
FVAKTNPTGTVNFGFTWYTLTMEINPNDTNGIYIASVDAGYSTNGGASWTGANYQHSDHHMAITGNGFLYVGHDGGLSSYKWNDFSQFNNLNNGLNITQFYHGDVSPHNNYVFGGTQDNGTKESRNFNPTFTNIFGGDGGYSFYHATKSTTRYYATQNGAMYRNGSNIANNLPVQTDAKWFIHPFTVSETIGEYILYPAGANIYFSSNEGNSFKKIGTTSTGRLFSAALSEDANPAAYTGGSNSLAAVDSVLNTTPKYKDLRSLMPSYIRASFVGSIKVVPGFRDKIYIAFNNIADSGRIWKVSNIFSTPVFTNISRSLPKGLPVNWVECDPFNPEEVIFAGTDYGLYVTEDGGLTWTKDTRVPSTVVSCIAIAKNKKDIYFFTHGRGIFKGLINNAGISSVDKTSIDILKTAYPIPASDVLNVELSINGSAAYQILDAQGKLVMTGNLSTGVNAVNTANLSSGNYVLIYTSPEGEGLIRFDILH